MTRRLPRAGMDSSEQATDLEPHRRPDPRTASLSVRALLDHIPVAWERSYLVAALILCGLLVMGHSAGQLIDRAELEERRSILTAGTDDTSTLQKLADAGRGSGAAAAASLDDLPADLPQWVQAVRGTNLWTGPDGGAARAQLSQWQYLKVVSAERSRFQVLAEDVGRTPGDGWVDAADVGVSTPPPSWVESTKSMPLYASSEGDETVGEVAVGTVLMLTGTDSGERRFAYLPGDDTSRRVSYGWVDAGSLAPANPPSGIALPSPSFRAVPINRPDYYRVALGDTLAQIAVAYGTSASELRRLNAHDATVRPVVGQVLKVPIRASGGQRSGPQKVRDLSPGWVSAEHAIVIDGASGDILWAREANTQVAPASLTKIISALVVIDHGVPSDRVTVHVDSRNMRDSTVMGVYPGEELTVEDLLYGMMLPSGNDAALALAEHVAGNRQQFAELMNEKMRSLGLVGSHFVNPHGLDAPGHLSTAHDMAMAAREGMKDPFFRSLASTRVFDAPRGKGYELRNLNQLLYRYAGADGVKIGYTEAAGRSIVGSATRDGHRVIVAMMRSADIYADSAALLDWAFASYVWSDTE